MSNFNRRDFLKISGGLAVGATVVGCATNLGGAAKARVVVVGGGVGGATAAKYLRMMDPAIHVTLIEPNKHYHTCFMSNEVLSGDRSIKDIEFGYAGLAGHGVNIVHDTVTGIDAEKRMVKTADGDSFMYDRCIVSPGISFTWGAIEGYDAKVAEKIPHAWKAGPQTVTLRKQLEAMRNGGTVVIAAPTNPFRCPPGPYERASLIAKYLKTHKPKSKIIILDPKDKFAKKGLFTQGWKRLYGYGTDNSLIEWVGGAAGGKVESVEANNMVINSQVESIKADVMNVIPPQKAGKIAFSAGLVNKKGWCPVDVATFESHIHKGVHVLGDASIATKMPKSGYSANIQAKACASAIVAMLNEKEPGVPSYQNTCYSIVGENYGISVGMIYKYSKAKNLVTPIKGSGGVTPKDASMETLKREAHYAHGWFDNITHDIFG
ncbi:cytochrome C [Solemya pervernicosa gill symbiont]|uniref:Cytochrome C n=2 Tax=Gammaproteobacteria incertae sedis TaxID=118884 RepID=A0A1T2LAS4_9GAMM|nr:FCSD flavin-binding domain-containing protein [Candidatus Reidiella endopervernicosa]OOZ42207.1 cytochrome C [Solemya pervernicosa gill symbiont]QKQ27226.1 FCSD flavin-binding domain-containing protein [Candidatus Reidiella endopervernicosa]